MSRYVLMLNDMREPNIENLTAVKVGSREELCSFVIGERDPHRDGRWGKFFRAGGPLEWFNAPNLEEDAHYWGGVYPIPDGISDEQAMALRLSKW